MFFLSCVEGIGGGLSRDVKIGIWPPLPVVYINQEDNREEVCRLGLPDKEDRVPIWELNKEKQGNRTSSASSETENQNRDQVFTNIESGPYIKVAPLISNKSNYHLVIHRVTFEGHQPFQAGYCESAPFLYYLPPGHAFSSDDLDRRFQRGNMWFYVPIAESNNNSVQTNDGNNFQQRPQIPSPTIRWKVEGTFKTADGGDAGTFYKTGGAFRTRPSSF